MDMPKTYQEARDLYMEATGKDHKKRPVKNPAHIVAFALYKWCRRYVRDNSLGNK